MDSVVSRMISTEHFEHPPRLHNVRGEVRKAGFELEYAGVDIEQSARLIREVFGGTETVISTFQRSIGTDLGRFLVEIDTSVLKDKKYESALKAIGIDPADTDLHWLEEVLLDTFSTVVPIEIATPPIPITGLSRLDDLRRWLREAKARGTRAALVYAFGMHINPEIASDDPGELRDVLRAFLLLYPWLKERAEVDIARRISPYVNAFPDQYARILLADDYPADTDRMIDDYMTYNPTRNRALDMLPVFAFCDEERVRMRLEEDSKLVKPRSAFHYRLPNCMIDEEYWTLAREWNLWVTVERLAADKERLAEMSRHYLAADAASFKPFTDKWPAVLDTYLS
jgi:hypothetical protein